MKLFRTLLFTTFCFTFSFKSIAGGKILSNDKYIFTIIDEDALRVFDRKTRQIVYEKPVVDQTRTDFCLSSDGTKLWYTNDDHIFSVKISDWSEFIEIKEDENFSWHTFNFTKDNQYLIYSKQTNDKNLVSEIYSLNTGEIIKTANQAKGEFIKKCFFDPSTNLLYTLFDRNSTTSEVETQSSGITDAQSVMNYQKSDGYSSVLTVINTTDNSIVFDKEIYYTTNSDIDFWILDKSIYLIAPYGVGKLTSLFEVSFTSIGDIDSYFIADKKIYFPGGFMSDIVDLSTLKTTHVESDLFHEEIGDAYGFYYTSSSKELVVLTDDYEVMTFSISNLKAAINQFKIKE
jgi:hypothetical protein